MTTRRAGTGNMAVWRNFVHQLMPVLPVPLKSPDADVHLPLKEAIDMVYLRGLYYLSINYQQNPPPPVFSEEEQNWMKGIIEGAKTG